MRRPEQPLELLSCEQDGKVSAVLRTNGAYSPATARSLAAGIAKALAEGARRPDDAAEALAAASYAEMEVVGPMEPGPCAVQAEPPTLIRDGRAPERVAWRCRCAGSWRPTGELPRARVAMSHSMSGHVNHAAGPHAFKRPGVLVANPIERTVAMLAGLQAGGDRAAGCRATDRPPRRASARVPASTCSSRIAATASIATSRVRWVSAWRGLTVRPR